MEKQHFNSLQKFDEPKSEILKKRLLKSVNTSIACNSRQNGSQNNVLLNSLRAPAPSSMIVSSMQAPQSSMSITHNLVTQSITPVKIHASNSPYPLHLSTVHVPVQIPGSTSNINVPVQLSGPTSTVPLQIAPVSLPLQVSGTSSVPMQLSAGETINVPLQIPGGGQNIQLTNATLPSMPLLHGHNHQLHSSIIHVHMGSNSRPANMEASQELTVSNASQLQITDSNGVQVKMNSTTPVSQVQVGSNPTVVQIPSSTNNSIQLRGGGRPMPHVVYIQTPTGLKPVTSTEVISQASTSGNPPQIIVRRPVTSNSNLHLLSTAVSSKPNIAPKLPIHNKSSILAPVNASQPIVIQKPKTNDKVIVPVSIAPGAPAKQAIAYLSTVKKPATKTISENQSILISNNQTSNPSNKLFLTPMNVNMNKIPNTKFILPVTLPATMASKGPIINLQIANGQIQNDPQGNITVMRDDNSIHNSEVPPLQPLGKVINFNGKEGQIIQGSKMEQPFRISISGSRAEPTGEQGEYTLSIPETNASMNDDIYTVSIEDDEGGQNHEKSFTLAIPEKGKSLLNRNVIERNEAPSTVITAQAVLKRSNSDNSERKNANANLKRRISLCTESLSKNPRTLLNNLKDQKKAEEREAENNDDHRVPSLFCDEKLDKDLEAKPVGDSDPEDYKDKKEDTEVTEENTNSEVYYSKTDDYEESSRIKSESETSDEDPPGLTWNNGIAALQGSMLQFQTNEFGLIDLVDNCGAEELIHRNAKYHTPLKQRIDRNRDKKQASPEDLYRCDGCGCHGMAAEFITPNFCSLTCQNEVEKVLQKRRDRERAELIKKRNKIKKILMRKQLSESEITPDKEEKVPLKQYSSMPATVPDAPPRPPSDFGGDNEKYPWMCGKNGFSWMRYLDSCKAKAAPVKLFKNPFPYTRNGFRVGMRMEAIDPQHPSLFCVVSVAEVQGYRMRLHFDGYPDAYDFWANADCPDLFPAGWCEKNGRTLQPPAGTSAASFSWPLYLKQMRAVAAPRNLFPHVTTSVLKPNCFRVGMKLEADDRKNQLVCVATVADMLDSRLRINFDSWDEMYDYWVEPSSPYIHPVGWAEENGIPLTPPNFYKDPDTFSWESYLSETNSTAAPPRAFKTRLPQGFKQGMKLEVVDKKVPFLIRVATISAVRGHQVRVSFDGWPSELDCWVDDDCPDLHPVGWCLKTHHPLEPPLTAEELGIPGPCGVGGCRGLGSARGGAHKQHSAASACPYRAPAAAPPDRRAPLAAERATPRERRYRHAHKQHSAASACPYRAPAAAPPDRRAPLAAERATPRERRYRHAHKQHSAASACPYRAPAAAPPDRRAPLAAERATPRERRYRHAHKQHSTASACPYRAPAAAPPDRRAPLAAERATPRERRYRHAHKQHSAASACPYRAPAAAAVGRRAPLAAERATPRERRYRHAHKQHSAASACPYRAPAAAPPDRRAPLAAERATPRERRYRHAHKQHSAASACPYRAPAAAPPDRRAPLAAERATPRERRYRHAHKQHSTASACPYRAPAAAPPDRRAPLAAERATPRERRYRHAHKQHSAASACPYRAPAAAAVGRRAPLAAERATPRERRYRHAHKQHSAASACPYRAPAAAPPDRRAPLAAERATPRERRVLGLTTKSIHASTPTSDPPKERPRGRPPKHKRVEEVSKNDASDEESVSSAGGKRWRGSSEGRGSEGAAASPASRATPAAAPAPLLHHLAALGLPRDPANWTEEEVCLVVGRVGGAGAALAVRAARLRGAELVMCSRDELVCCARLRLGPAVKVYAMVRQLRAMVS